MGLYRSPVDRPKPKKGRGWHGERGRHSDAARGIKTRRYSRQHYIDMANILGTSSSRSEITSEIERLFAEDNPQFDGMMFRKAMLSARSLQDRADDLMDEAIEAMYDAGRVGIAHDVERGALDKAWNDISKELAIAEKRKDIDDIKRLRAAKEALKAIP